MILKKYNEITWCFNHFDGTNKEWKKKSWYNKLNCLKNIGIGSKITQWKKITPNIAKKYNYLWFLDGDMGLEKFNWKYYYNMLLRINPILSQPGISASSKNGRASDWPHLCCTNENFNTIQKTHRGNAIENQSPFINTIIWPLIYEKMALTNVKSDWEVCFFYNKIADDLDSIKLVNFFSPVVHHDFRNLNKIKSVDSKRELIESPHPDNYENKILNIKKNLLSLG